MANLNVPSPFATIRAAINAAATGDTIVIAAGTYSVTAGGGPATLAYVNPLNNPTYNATGFNPVTSLSYTGAGKTGAPTGTTLTGNARLYQSNIDGGLANSPISVSYSNFQVLYSSATNNYILSAGRAGTSAQNTSGATVANTKTKTITVNNVDFTGTHAGNPGATGNYIDLAGIQTVTFTNNSVNVTGQSGFTGTTAVSGGSSFLLVQGGQTGSITVSSNTFNESGYRNGISIYESANVTLASNTFSRSTASTRFVRTNGSGAPKSNKIANSTNVTVGGTTSANGNTFSNGSFLALEGGSGTVRFNTFDGTNMAAASSGAIGISLEGSTAPAYTYQNNSFVYVSPYVNSTTNPVFVTTGGTNDNTFRNSLTGNNAAIQQYITGTTGNDTLTSTLSPGATSRRDFISGGLGNDTLDGGAGTSGLLADADFFLFNTTLNSTTNVDTIINWTASTFTTQNNQSDQLVLDRKIFKNLTVTSNVSGNAALGIGVLAAAAPPAGATSAAGGQLIANTNGTFTSTTSGERIALATGGSAPGSLYYQAGDGSPAFLFARITTGSIGSNSWVTSLNQLGNIAVI